MPSGVMNRLAAMLKLDWCNNDITPVAPTLTSTRVAPASATMPESSTVPVHDMRMMSPDDGAKLLVLPESALVTCVES